MATNNWFVWAILSAFFAALTAIFAKMGLHHVNPYFATLIHTTVVLIMSLGIVSMSGAWPNSWSSFSGWLVASGLSTGASWLCYFRALRIGDASKVAPVDKLSVVLVALLAFALLGERPSPRDWAGIAMIAAGVLVLSLGK
jgi:transporter family protein